MLVPDYNTNAKNGKNYYIGTQNKSIRDLLDVHELQKCIVKAVAFTKLTRAPSDSELAIMPLRSPDKQANSYYYQDYKIACPNIEYAKVMEFLRTADLATIGMIVKDVDVTMDYAGSFDKGEVIDHLVENEHFRVQGSFDDATRTIVDNDARVGRYCLTYMETVDSICTRKKDL